MPQGVIFSASHWGSDRNAHFASSIVLAVAAFSGAVLNGHLSIPPHTLPGSLMFLLPYLSLSLRLETWMISIIFGSPSPQWIQKRCIQLEYFFLFTVIWLFFQFRYIYLSWWHLEKSRGGKKDFEEIFRWILNFTHIFLVFTPSLVSKATLLQEYSTLCMLSTQLSYLCISLPGTYCGIWNVSVTATRK